jgi:hypothetical protein
MVSIFLLLCRLFFNLESQSASCSRFSLWRTISLWLWTCVANLNCEYRDTTLSCREDRWRTARKSRRTSTSGLHSSRNTRRVICLVSFAIRSFIFRSSIFLSLSTSWFLLFRPSPLLHLSLHSLFPRVVSLQCFLSDILYSRVSTAIICTAFKPNRSSQCKLQHHILTRPLQSGQPGTKSLSHTRKQVQPA